MNRIFLIILCILPQILFSYPSPTIQNDPEKTEKTLNKLKSNIQKVENDLNKKQREESKALLALKQIETRIGENSEKLRIIQENIIKTHQALIELEEKSKLLYNTHKSEQTALSKQMTARFKTFKKEKLQLFFGQHDLTRLMRVKYYYHYFNQAREQYLNSLSHASLAVLEAKKQLTREQSLFKQLEQEKINEESALQTDKESRKILLTTLNNSLFAQKSDLSQMKQKEKMLTELLHTLQKKINQFTPPEPSLVFSKMKGKLLSPVQGQQYSLKTLARALLKDKKNVYIEANEGTEVHAIYRGRVIFADWLRGLGQLLIIDHGNGFMSLYGYNQILYKRPGDSVKIGEKISLVGQSGGQAKPGLYFEIRKDGNSLDPAPWFQ